MSIRDLFIDPEPAVAQNTHWACVEEETQAEPIHVALQMERWKDRHRGTLFQNIPYMSL